SLTNSLDTRNHLKILTTFLSGQPGRLYLCINNILIDDLYLPSSNEATRWVKCVSIKINVFAWRARLDRLPTRCNLLSRGVEIESLNCPICGQSPEDARHIFFQCDLAKAVLRRVCRWWDIQWVDIMSFEDWNTWFSSIRLSSNLTQILEGVFYVAWWHIWAFRNNTIFNDPPPRRAVISDDIISQSFMWCSSRCSSPISWDVWLKNPYLISL
nr:RNA-directed DNA polymerase, eukaryota [Tanacetum cinerariifolium]